MEDIKPENEKTTKKHCEYDFETTITIGKHTFEFIEKYDYPRAANDGHLPYVRWFCDEIVELANARGRL